MGGLYHSLLCSRPTKLDSGNPIALCTTQFDPLVWEKETVRVEKVGDQAVLGRWRDSVNTVQSMKKAAGRHLPVLQLPFLV